MNHEYDFGKGERGKFFRPGAEFRVPIAQDLADASANMDLALDWTQCELIECVPGKVSGQPVVSGTRIMPDAIVGSFDLGETIEELHAGFPTLTIAQLERLIEFAHQQRPPGTRG